MKTNDVEDSSCLAEIDGNRCNKPVIHWWVGDNSILHIIRLIGFCEEHKLWVVKDSNGWYWKQISYEEAITHSVMEV